MKTIAYTEELIVVTCWCGMHHAVPRVMYEHQQRCHDNRRNVPDIYCPLGHTHVPAGEAQVEQLQRKLANRDEDLRAERAAHAATKAKLTKTTKRVQGGVCPCCDRSFVQLARHMKTKHPDYEVTQ